MNSDHLPQRFCRPLRSCLFAVITLVAGTAAAATADGAGVTIAEPQPYESTAGERLGINDNGKGLAVGTEIGDVVLKDIHGADVNLAGTWNDSPALVVFYRGGWCPYCNAQVRELSVRYEDFVKAGVQPVLISVDSADNTALINAQYDIPFPVLSDPELVAHRLFNVVLELDDATLAAYEDYGLDLSKWSGRDHHAIAVASAFLVDRGGRVVFSHAPEDYRQRPSADQLLTIIAGRFPGE